MYAQLMEPNAVNGVRVLVIRELHGYDEYNDEVWYEVQILRGFDVNLLTAAPASWLEFEEDNDDSVCDSE